MLSSPDRASRLSVLNAPVDEVTVPSCTEEPPSTTVSTRGGELCSVRNLTSVSNRLVHRTSQS